ncbi:MAG: hypothetical protein GY847_14005 [Proteobacteria bacterium]|nr:hypothetical protein [Pseudomonadota bacterium]
MDFKTKEELNRVLKTLDCLGGRAYEPFYKQQNDLKMDTPYQGKYCDVNGEPVQPYYRVLKQATDELSTALKPATPWCPRITC